MGGDQRRQSRSSRYCRPGLNIIMFPVRPIWQLCDIYLQQAAYQEMVGTCPVRDLELHLLLNTNVRKNVYNIIYKFAHLKMSRYTYYTPICSLSSQGKKGRLSKEVPNRWCLLIKTQKPFITDSTTFLKMPLCELHTCTCTCTFWGTSSYYQCDYICQTQSVGMPAGLSCSLVQIQLALCNMRSPMRYIIIMPLNHIQRCVVEYGYCSLQCLGSDNQSWQ